MAEPTASLPTPTIGRSLAAELFVLGFPLVLVDAVRRAHPLLPTRFHKLPADPRIIGGGLAEHDIRTVQSSAMIDLTGGPSILHLPDVRGRYFSLTLIDSAGEAFASLGSRTRDPGASDIALVGPGWRGEIKRGFRARRAPSDLVWAVSRITANSVADLPLTEDLAARQCAVPLLTPAPAGSPAALPSLEPMAFPLAQQIAELAPEILLHRLALLIERAPAPLRRDLGPIVSAHVAGLGGPEGVVAWPDALRQALSRGFADGLAAIVGASRTLVQSDDEGWNRVTAGEAHTPLARASRAFVHLGAPLPEDVLTLTIASDESGRPLNGHERYRIQFPAGGLPPVEAVWRLAALPLSPYGEPGAPPVHGALSEHSDLLFNPDGALELLIQADAPEGGRAVNWLQSPHQPFGLQIRLYWPGAAALDGTWRMPPVERLGSRFARRAGARPAAARKIPKPPPGSRSLRPAVTSWRTSP